jgi:hypothetical protein
MPGTARADDEMDLIRTDFCNLESSEWWKSLNLDGVVLYAWGSPKFRKVASAIHNAGIFLVLNQDNGGLVSPLAGFRDWFAEQWILSGQGRGSDAWLRFLRLVLRGMSAGLVFTDPLRASHLNHGDVIACVSPKAAIHYRKLCGIYGGAVLANRVRVIPHAVESHFHLSSEPKLRQVVCVGRWQDVVQKRLWLLTNVIGELVIADEQVSVLIAGALTDDLKTWHQALPEAQRARVRVLGRVERDKMVTILSNSQVFYTPSAFESFGIAAAESLCSGCSVVAGRSVSMASFEWFVSESSGTLTGSDDCNSHVSALIDELKAWEDGQRDAVAISKVWCERLHADKVAESIARCFYRWRADAEGAVTEK